MSVSATPAPSAVSLRNPLAGLPGLSFIGENPKVAFGLLLLAPILFAAVFAQWLPLPRPLETNPAESFATPGMEHLFGTDKLGRDILSRTVAGAQVSLLVGFGAAGIAIALGVIIGSFSVFSGKWVDGIITSAVDMLLSFPSLLMAIALVAITGAGVGQVILAIVIADLPRAIRLQRSLALGLKSRAYMDAARMAGAGTWWLLLKHLIPNTVAPMVVVASIYAANAILVEASLSFLGLGIIPPQPSWGNIIREGQRYLLDAWWISTFPGLVLLLVTMGLHFVADGIRAGLDPTMKV